MKIGSGRVVSPELQGDFTPEGGDCKDKSYDWRSESFLRQIGKVRLDLGLLELCHSGTIQAISPLRSGLPGLFFFE
jgi:hypothetical protein